MDLEARVAELERRLDALEADPPPRPEPPEGDFWALEGWKERLPALGADTGGVLFTGAVTLPTGERYEWQQAAPTTALLDAGPDGPDGPDGGTGGGTDGSRTADSLAALGNPVRLRLLREILAGRRTAAELTALDGVGTSGQVYHHLRQLTAAGWLHTTGRGRHEVPGARVVPLLVLLSAATP
ncbi:transcriptional regulator [Streptomyces lavendulae subsp. lavendulae]|uniref:ArsR/SmtB family transcription factor n=1 Tax=Streptomyces lavendulae TaxID=1914 RepID=UPI0024A1808A|nr:winged helix-turn-helix domain-containing protein [Streptomyces lavendulae]GLV87833.1 transcriptional regulator [Streptomyces lavendulae subsp. lavendulae]